MAANGSILTKMVRWRQIHVDDDYYVAEDGHMLTNEWKKTMADEDEDDPEDGGEHWYYFNNKGKKSYRYR